MLADVSVLFSCSACGSSVSSISMIEVLCCSHVADWPGVGVVFGFLDLWLSSWISVVLVSLSISDDSPEMRVWALLADVQGEGSGDNNTKSDGVLDPRHSETGEEGRGTAATPAEKIALWCNDRISSPAFSEVNFAVGCILWIGREDIVEGKKGGQNKATSL